MDCSISSRARGALALLGALFVAGSGAAHAAIVLDGRFDEPEWSQAHAFDDFVVTQPYTLATPTHPTRVRMIGTPEGIAFAFEAEHPPTTERQRSITPRDADIPGDRVNVYIDFDGDAKVAYNFTVGLTGALQDGTITNENVYTTDWDGDWEAAVAETDAGYTIEILLPWTVAAMNDTDTATRTVKVQFDRVIAANLERSASSPAFFSRARYVSEFAPVEIAQYEASILRFFPYATAISDQIAEDVELKFGGDVFWKPSGSFQLTAAINPDFGQVEADELVVNFDAIETFFSDRRPFFTENQALFDLRTPDSGLLIYTRRIGGPRDDEPARAAEIDAAVKLNGSAHGFDYGVLTAFERDYADEVGSAFYAQRLVHPGPEFTLGYLGTYVDRPFLDRNAIVNAVDLAWRPNAQWIVTSQVLASAIDDGANGLPDDFTDDYDGTGAWFRAFYTPNAAWQNELEVTHFDDTLDFNDMGFQRRASLNELEYTVSRRFSDFGADDPRGAVRWSLEPQLRWNDSGDRLPGVLLLVRDAQQKSGATLVTEVMWQSRGIDDLISRGNGNVSRNPRLSVFQNYTSQRRGDWKFTSGVYAFQEGIDGWALQLENQLIWYAAENLTLSIFADPRWSEDWLVWQEDDLFGSYARFQLFSGFNVDWFPAPSHEFRLKTQWLAIDAHDGEAYRIGAGDRLARTDEAIRPFTVNNFGIQARYRWTFAPQSDLYVVYSRGGFAQQDGPELRDATFDLFRDAIELRDADQFLVKVRYRFD